MAERLRFPMVELQTICAREWRVLVIAVLSAMVPLLLELAGGEAGAALSAIFLPMLLCLWRASLVPDFPAEAGLLRAIGYKLTWAMALVLLMLFEIGLAISFQADDMPLSALAYVAGFGAGYLFLFGAANKILQRQIPTEREPFVY